MFCIRRSLILLCFIFSLTVVIIGNKILHISLTKTSTNSNEFLEIVLDDIEKNKINQKDLGILVDVDYNILYLMDINNNVLIKKYTVATGKYNTPTPLGTFKIIQKCKWGAGFGTRWMKLNVPWGQYGIHGTDKPYSIGYSSSHGCVRMKNNDIEELYDIVVYNTPVILFKGQYGPFGNGFRIIKPGDKGSDVLEVQKRLKLKGYYNGLLDGVYGDGLKRALHKFLKDNNLKESDWIVHSIYKMLEIEIMD